MLKLRKPLLPPWRYWPAILLLTLVGVAVVGLTLSPSLPSPQQKQTAQSNPYSEVRKAVHEAFVVLENASADNWIACFTGLTMLIFGGQLIAMRRANTHFRVTERAYVKMSHYPPGVRWEGITGGKFSVTVRVRNHGRTPAEITDAVLIREVHNRATIVPEYPDYGQPKHKIPTTSFLVTEDEFIFAEEFEVSGADREEIDSGTKVLTILGYVDYIDRFGQRYRGGYARVYRPPTAEENIAAGFSGVISTQNNLALFPNRKRNFDRPRLRGEGNDWDDNA